MRKAVIHALVALARSDPRVVLLTADLGYTVVEPFAEAFPDRFFNVGVAEQNMMGIATGLAEAGLIPYVYSIANFAALRPYEFIRNGPAMHGCPVRILAVGGGYEYGTAGYTHHCLEDLALMRTLPGLTVLAPADFRQAGAAVRTAHDLPGPVYFRLGKDDSAVLPGLQGCYALDDAPMARPGHGLLMVTTGSIALEAHAAAEALDAALVVLTCLQPAPVTALAGRLADFRRVMTVEEHVLAGGLGSLVAEVMAETGHGGRLLRCGVTAPPDGVVGSMAFMRHRQGLDREALLTRARAWLAGGTP